jgi:crossover junction endodeoxyribonuclease RusA
MVISKEGRTFRQRVWDLWFVEKYVFRRNGFGKAPVRIDMVISPPDRRRRDLDNVLKAILDGIQHAGIIEDDAQVESLSARWTVSEPPGFVVLRISDLESNESGCRTS